MQIVKITAHVEVGVPKSLQHKGVSKYVVPQAVVAKFLSSIDSIGTMGVFNVIGDADCSPIADFGQKDITDGTPQNENLDVFQTGDIEMFCLREINTAQYELRRLTGSVKEYAIPYKGLSSLIQLRINQVEIWNKRNPKPSFYKLEKVGNK